MKNGMELWIGTQRADLDDASFILLNYTMEELSNPTVVRNSFSRQITLKGTPNNSRIFGGIYRNDRSTQYGGGETGVYFDPTRKTSFRIFSGTGELLEDGYLKLDKVVTVGRRHDYVVTLYGGLGSFLYGLSYDSDGNKLTLADLDFGQSIDFTINRTTVSDAWARIGGNTSKPAKYDIVNFIPAYMGLPPSPFDANKCFVYPSYVGLQTQGGDNGEYKAAQTIVTLNEKVTGEAARDLRSYLQKPCIKVSAVIDAILSASGYTVNKDATFFDNSNPYWAKSWMTLPALNDLNVNETETTNTQTMSGMNIELPIVGGGGSGLYKVTVNAIPYTDMMGLPASNFKLWCRTSSGDVVNMVTFSVTLYDALHNAIRTATYRVTTDGLSVSSQYPQPDYTFDHIDAQGWFVDSNGNRVTIPLYVEAQGASYYRVEFSQDSYSWGSASFEPGDQSAKMWEVGENDYTNSYRFEPIVQNASVDIVGVASSTVRTGAVITKAILLGGGHTPAEYLLSFCKMFGIQIVAHKGEKVVDLVLRKNFYNGVGALDINGRIDRGKEMEKVPFAFDARWYLFGKEATGEFADYYQSRYNRPFGQYRVNTGYEFDAEEKNMTEDIVFGNACSLMEASPYFCQLTVGGKNIPPVFLSGGKYLLYRGSETMSLDLPYLADASRTWYNTSYPMHDFVDRLQFHGEQDAHTDERDTLVFFSGMVDTSAKHLSLTDDTEEMLYLNGNNPCWMPNICDAVSSWKLNAMPRFSRYVWSSNAITYSFDWGDPKELQIPNATVTANSNIFDAYWKKYIADRYDDDSAVVTCYVDLRGMQVGNDLFRRFYYFDGAVWALNRIINHSLTTAGPTQCEFVKVQDTTNYTN